MKTVLSVLAIIFILVACLVMSACFPAGEGEVTLPPVGDLSRLDPDGDGEVTFQGVVVENNPGCEVDAACFLRVRLDGRAVTVLYHYGEWPPCDNGEAITQGFAVTEGDKVEIAGTISEGGAVSTCESNAYYIRKLGHRLSIRPQLWDGYDHLA
jgi:hypothetical protein